MSLSKEMYNGFFWSAIEKYSGLIISIVISSILARLISATDFGVISVATVIITFLIMFTDLGIAPAIIQHKELTSDNLDSIFTFTLVGGLILALLFFFSAHAVSRFYANEKLTLVCKILSIQIFFSAINIVPRAELSKNKEFKKIAKRTLLLQVITGIISVVVAYRTRSLYSLLISPVLTSIGVFLYNFGYYPRKIDWKMDRTAMKKISSFSLYQFLFGIVNFFSRNLDSILIGKSFDMASLGFYDKAYRLMLLPVQNISNVVSPVIQPVFSEIQSDKNRIAQECNKLVKLLSIISFPLGILLFFTAREIITIFYGNNWQPSIPLFQILALSLPFQIINSILGAVYQSANATRSLFYNGLINALITVVLFILSIVFFKTVIAVAWAWTIAVAIGFVVNFYMLYNLVLNVSFFEIFSLTKIPLLIGLLLWIALQITSHLLPIENIMITLCIKCTIALIISLAIIHLTKYYNVLNILDVIKKMKNKKK